MGNEENVKPAKVLIVDDQQLYREGLRELMGHWPEFRVIGEASNGRKAVEFCRMQVPDFILMDVQMPVMNGVEATGIICKSYPDVKVVMLTVSADDDHLIGAVRNGAVGYILKDIPARQLRNRLQGVLAGEGALSGRVALTLMRRMGMQAGSPIENGCKRSDFTERELQLLELVVEGLSNEEIGHRLYLSSGTVKKQLSTLMQKLCLENRVQLAVYAIRAGLV